MGVPRMTLKVINVARREIGYLEKQTNAQLDDKTANAGYRNWTKYARDLDKLGVYNFPKNGYDWCDIFVDWCFYKAYGVNNMVKMIFQPKGGLGAGCTYSMGYYRNHKRLYKNPMPGDQIFFSNDGWATSYHTGIVEKVEGNRVYTIEGNTSNASGVVSNGGGVARKSYPISYGMYGRPDFSIVDAYEEEDEEMTYEDFKMMMNQYLEEKNNEKPGDWSKNSRKWAEANGLIKGDENGNKRYKANITREEFTEVLYRYHDMK